LFKHLDKAAKGSIDYQMFVSEFPEINSKWFLHSFMLNSCLHA
jgi:hypothetical protein